MKYRIVLRENFTGRELAVSGAVSEETVDNFMGQFDRLFDGGYTDVIVSLEEEDEEEEESN